jgi:4-aminobutyrate aminotransferase-like enzyme
MLAAMTKSADITNEVILKCQDKGLILFWLLFEGTAIQPPLTISEEEIEKAMLVLDENYIESNFQELFLSVANVSSLNLREMLM